MSTIALPRGTDTKERILRAAELIFGRHGYAGTTLRAVTAEAGVNLASANYHFGSKEALVMEMLRQRVAPINEERLLLLEKSKQRANGGPIPLEEILEALILPLGGAARGPDGPDRSRKNDHPRIPVWAPSRAEREDHGSGDGCYPLAPG